MQNLFNTIDQSGWTGIILFGTALLAIVLFIELHTKKQDKILVGDRWVKNDYYPLPGRILIAIVIFIFGLSLFFIIKFFIK